VARLSRRSFMNGAAALIASSVVAAASEASFAEVSSPRRIGVLLGGLSPQSREAQEFRKGLRDAGYIEGRDVVIEWRSAGGDSALAPRLANDLVEHKVEVIVATGTVAAQAAKRATSTIPIVASVVADPVGSGLVASLNHPGGNITGLSNMLADLSAKRLQLLKETIPSVGRVAVLWNPATPWHSEALQNLKRAAASQSVELIELSIQKPEEFGTAMSAVKRTKAEALYVFDDALFLVHRTELVKLASQVRLPAVYGTRDFPDVGGLMSYGANMSDLYRRSAQYVDKILRGAKPGDLPIEQPTVFELVINVKSAAALGLNIPQSILVRADDVIK